MDKKKKTRNHINRRDNDCFHYARTVSLNHKQIWKHAERITKIKLFIDKYNQEEINFPSQKDDLKQFEKKYVAIAVNVLYAKK